MGVLEFDVGMIFEWGDVKNAMWWIKYNMMGVLCEIDLIVRLLQ